MNDDGNVIILEKNTNNGNAFILEQNINNGNVNQTFHPKNYILGLGLEFSFL